jgi:hypothetical protein
MTMAREKGAHPKRGRYKDRHMDKGNGVRWSCSTGETGSKRQPGKNLPVT